MRTPKVIVVGAGAGGLAAAIDLGRCGAAVTVLERAGKPGGKLRQETPGGAGVDAGPTVLTMRWVFDDLFAAAGTSVDAHVTLHPTDLLARHAWSATERLDLFADVGASVDAIGAFAGRAEAEGYQSFVNRAAKVYRTLEGPFIRSSRPTAFSLAAGKGLRGVTDMWGVSPFSTLWKALGEHFRDPRLRQLFGRYSTYSGSSPFDAPATLMLIAHVEQQGVWLAQGGMVRLAEALAEVARSQGAEIRSAAPVSQITMRDGHARGVVLASGERIEADAVVCAADAAALATGALGRSMIGAVPLPKPSGRSLSAVTWCLLAETEGFALTRHNVFFGRDYKSEFDDIFKRNRLPQGPTVYVCAQDRGEPGSSGRSGAGAVAGAGQCAADRRPACVHSGGDRAMRDEDVRPVGTLRPDGAPARGGDGGDHADGVSPDVSGDGRGAVRAGGARIDGGVSPAGGTQRDTRPVSGGGQRASGTGGSDGGAVGAAGGSGVDGGPDFQVTPPAGGYVWWYVDALSDDGAHGITIIAFLGSVFSPYYAWARRRGGGDPLRHCALNVALYGRERRWAMTERGAGSLDRGTDYLSIGPSGLEWDGSGLTVRIEEVCMPVPRRVRGTVRLYPSFVETREMTLDSGGRHRWRPIAPCARVEVVLERPGLSWSGPAYFDTNYGERPLEADFVRWDWSRAAVPGGTAVLYDVERRDGPLTLAMRYDAAGGVTDFAAPGSVGLPRTFWRVPRRIRAGSPVVTETLEDTPFYARSVVAADLLGGRVTAMHESLSMGRFVSPVVQAMLPFRMPRVGG